MNTTSRKLILTGMFLFALGIVFKTTLSSSAGNFGIVILAIGGIFLIAGMSRKRIEEEKKQKKQ